MTTSTSKVWATGSCLCNEVQYSLVKQPKKVERYLCHCVLCKKASGSAFMSNWWMDDDVLSIEKGEDFVSTIDITATRSGHRVTRSFCRNCGSPLFLRTTNPVCDGQMGITAGTLDFDDSLPPEENLALHWTPDGEAFVQHRFLCLSEVQGVPQWAPGRKQDDSS